MFDFTMNTMLRRLTFQFFESNHEQEAKRIQHMLPSVSSTVIEVIEFILGEESPDGVDLWDHIGLGMIDDILNNHAQFRGLQKVAFAVNAKACPTLECVPATMQKAVEERMPKTVERGVPIAIQIHRPV